MNRLTARPRTGSDIPSHSDCRQPASTVEGILGRRCGGLQPDALATVQDSADVPTADSVVTYAHHQRIDRSCKRFAIRAKSFKYAQDGLAKFSLAAEYPFAGLPAHHAG